MSVSIGLPFYNAEAYLADAIRSVFAQTYQDWELILVDDGSTDNSLEIALSVEDPRVRVISDGNNLKLAARLNEITKLARYDLIARMDADDLMSPDRIARQVKVLQELPTVDLVSTGLVSVDGDGNPIGVRVHISEMVSRAQLLRRQGCGIVHASVLGRRAWFERNPYDPTFAIAQDFELWMRTSRLGDLSVRALREPLYYVRELSSATPDKMVRSYRMDRRSIRKHRDSPLDWMYVGKSLLKTVALRIITLTGHFDRLVKMRSQPLLDDALLAKVAGDLELIRSAKVPGLSSRKW